MSKADATNHPLPSTSTEKKRKKCESKFDPSKLRKLIKEGKSAKEIMSVMDINHKQILKHHLLKLCAMDNCFYDIIGLYGQNTRKAYVNAKGSIMIKNNMVDFKSLILEPEKTVFDVEVDDVKKQIILTVIEHNPVVNNNIDDKNIYEEVSGDSDPIE